MTFDVFLDKTRDKCMELIYDALCSDSTARASSPFFDGLYGWARQRTAPDLIFKRAQAIEEGTYSGCDSETSASYKAKMRSLYLNLKDKNNPQLRLAIIEGDIPADKLHSMSPQEMASEERKAHDQAIKDANLFDSLGAAAAKRSATDVSGSRFTLDSLSSNAHTPGAARRTCSFVAAVNNGRCVLCLSSCWKK